jgi:hypothetical protein
MARLLVADIDVKNVRNLYQDNEIIKRLAVKFKDKDGRMFYWWVPEWKDIAILFQDAHDVEVCNEGGDEGLFINAAFEVIAHELERCGLQANYAAILKEMAHEVELASNMNLAKPIRWDDSDLD